MEIDEDFEKHIKAKFEAIKAKAYKNKMLIFYDSTADTTYTRIDNNVYQIMKYLYFQYNRGELSKEDAVDNVDKLWLRYLNEKISEQRKANAAKEQQDKEAKADELIRIFIEPGNRTPEQLLVLLFDEFLPIMLDPVTAQKIKDGFGF